MIDAIVVAQSARATALGDMLKYLKDSRAGRTTSDGRIAFPDSKPVPGDCWVLFMSDEDFEALEEGMVPKAVK